MPDKPAPTWPPRKAADLASAATRVAEIVSAAERAADELRADAERAAEELRCDAERRASERIAEAERAADMRVRAADEDADAVRGDAKRFEQEERERAAASARVLLGEARTVAREVLHDGEEISGHLRELADSLRANAERLLRDIREVHEELVSRLDQADPSHWTGTDRSDTAAATAPIERAAELDVPEFVPSATGRPRR